MKLLKPEKFKTNPTRSSVREESSKLFGENRSL